MANGYITLISHTNFAASLEVLRGLQTTNSILDSDMSLWIISSPSREPLPVRSHVVPSIENVACAGIVQDDASGFGSVAPD